MLNIYRASAGSGKTYRLTQDYIHLLFDPRREHTHRHILAVTFTNKATDEMKSRILTELHTLAQGDRSDYREGLMRRYRLSADEVNARARQVLIDILHDYSSFSISTIDRFFLQVIRAFARDIGVNSAYSLELDNNRTLEQAVDNLFLDLSKSENRQLLQWLTQLAEERVEQAESWNMRRNIAELGQEIFKENFQYKAEETSRILHDRNFLRDYKRELHKIKHDFEQQVKGTAAEALQIMAFNGLATTDFKGGSRSAMNILEKLRRGNLTKEPTDTFYAMGGDVTACYTAKSVKPATRAAIETAYANGLQQCIVRLQTLFTKGILRYHSADIVLKHLNTLGVLADLALQVKTLTEEQNAMLLSDTNMLLNRIIDHSDTPFVYERTGIRIDHYMIDEFQDTSVLQWKNFKPLLADSLAAGHFNLVVGDVKQSIYRWRNSDWKLLDEHILHDFRREDLHEEDLDTNWRSDRNIVRFNNAFFRQAARLLQSKLNENLEPLLALPAYKNRKELKELHRRITHAYANLYQKPSPRAGEGRVAVHFIDKSENDEGWRRESLERLPALIEDLQERGYAPADIAILVRKNEEEQAVIRHLLHYKTTDAARADCCYDIMGNEGLPVGSASSVRFLLGLLRLFVNPADSIQRSVVTYEYLRGKSGMSKEEALNATFATDNRSDDRLLPPAAAREEAALGRLLHHALYDMVEQLIALFDTGSWPGEAVFVQSFQDIVLKFSTGKAADLNSFLRWWDKNGEKQCVPSPDDRRAIRIMTIHKSKGLDFRAVIIPFADWELDSRKRDILWCAPQAAPFDRFPLLPVEYSSKLSRSVFAPEYFDEQMHQYIDNLNVAYVAFTRAKNELICLTPAPKKEVAELKGMNSLSALLSLCFRLDTPPEGDDPLDLSAGYDPDTLRYELGSPAVRTSADRPADRSEKPDRYPTVPAGDRLRIRHTGLDFWLEGQQLTDSRINYGTIMHRILQEIARPDDQERVVRRCVHEGLISEAESRFVHDTLDRFWTLPHTGEWFADGLRVLTEATILTPQGAHYRPDRVTIDTRGVATIVDYKFGDREQASYLDQVRQYMRLVAQMGYPTRGFVCYVSLEKVVEVNE